MMHYWRKPKPSFAQESFITIKALLGLALLFFAIVWGSIG